MRAMVATNPPTMTTSGRTHFALQFPCSRLLEDMLVSTWDIGGASLWWSYCTEMDLMSRCQARRLFRVSSDPGFSTWPHPTKSFPGDLQSED